ncbi:homeobox-domain-containing protein [Backusella circina FSU 941]|nr:homeobox-domain-containing protein [Backusella circina FSU 941]
MSNITATSPHERQQSVDDSKKRTRVTPSQLAILEETFTVSATPDSKMRKQLASRLDMPERSIQIWFQNRRAKVKMLQRRALLRQEQEVARARLCAEATSNHPYWYPKYNAKLPINRAWSSDIISPPPPPLYQTTTTASAHSPFPPLSTTTFNNNNSNNNNNSIIHNNNNNNNNMNNISHMEAHNFNFGFSPSPTAQHQSQPFIVPRRMESEPLQIPPHMSTTTSTTSTTNNAFLGTITATAVTVGSWHRMKINHQDLMCYYRLANERNFSWHIQDSNYHFKMVISFDSISCLELSILSDGISAQIDIDLLEPPIFFMEDENGNWTQCSDFTEGMQASCVLRHTVRGLASDLHQELLNIVTVDQGLDQIARFPVIDPLSHHHHQEQHMLQQPFDHQEALLLSNGNNGNWRHQSLPPASVRDYWSQPYPI